MEGAFIGDKLGANQIALANITVLDTGSGVSRAVFSVNGRLLADFAGNGSFAVPFAVGEASYDYWRDTNGCTDEPVAVT